MNDNNDTPPPTGERITRWVTRLEKQVEELLLKRELDELDQLSVKDRLVLGTKYLALLQHFLLLSQRVEATTSHNPAQQALEKIMERMRGEWPLA